jgi:hypothetical protein
MRRHGGEATVRSGPDLGTEVRLVLPRLRTGEAPADGPPADATGQPGAATDQQQGPPMSTGPAATARPPTDQQQGASA